MSLATQPVEKLASVKIDIFVAVAVVLLVKLFETVRQQPEKQSKVQFQERDSAREVLPIDILVVRVSYSHRFLAAVEAID